MENITVVNIEDLEEWRKQNPTAEWVRVKHGDFGLADWIFNYKDPKDVTISESLGQYDAWGNLHFIDSNGHKHICLSRRPHHNYLSLKYKWHNQ